MTDTVGVEFEGVDELAAGIRQLDKNVAGGAPAEFQHVADQVADQVRGRLPRRTGQLAGSVETRRDPRGAQVTMGGGVRYAPYVEYGGRGFPHSPQGNYLTPAATDAEPRLVDAGTRLVNREIGAIW